jgi:hypothetical protein
MPIWRGNTYRFTVTAATAAAGDVYTNNGQNFTVTDAITAGTVLFCTGTGAPTASGNLVRTSGAGTDPIVFSAVTAPNTNWGTSTNWLTDGSGAGVPTALTDAVFDNVSQNCTVNVAGLCRNLNFNSGTGYVNTITMTNGITVGSTTAITSVALTLASGMGIGGSGAINTRTNTTVTFRSNGRQWPNALGMNTIATANSSSAIVIADNWTINGTLTIGTGVGHTYTISGAFNVTCNGNFVTSVLATAASSRIAGAAGNQTTFILAGNTTWSSPQGPMGIGVNITINAPGNTVTIADGCSYGGLAAVSGSTFSYVAGTVITLGTFHLMFNASGPNYTVNLNGDPSTSATTTSSTGVNFNNLSLRTSVISNQQTCTLTSNICVVNEFSITSYTTGVTKGIANILGNNAYLNGNVTINGTTQSGTTIFRLQGTGTWSENQTLSIGVTGFGINNAVVINTAGTITLGSFVGLRNGSFTYTAGNFITTNYGLRVGATTMTGFGSGNVFIETLYHTTLGALASTASAITINDSGGTPKPQLSIGTLTFDGFTTSNTHRYAGNAGWKCNTFLYQSPPIVAATLTLGFIGSADNLYTVNSNLTATVFSPSFTTVFARNPGGSPSVNFVLTPGASQDLYYIGGTQINSDAGQTIWTRKGSLFQTSNWNLWTYPRTRFSSFTS